tara:strand:- start:46 stop:243 length:198 start_codon:yes stop_codon:yes gene_type:complete
MTNKIMEAFSKMLFQITEPEKPEAEKPVDEDPVSNCCTAPFTYPGWPDSDTCSECYEHAGVDENE